MRNSAVSSASARASAWKNNSMLASSIRYSFARGPRMTAAGAGADLDLLMPSAPAAYAPVRPAWLLSNVAREFMMCRC